MSGVCLTDFELHVHEGIRPRAPAYHEVNGTVRRRRALQYKSISDVYGQGCAEELYKKRPIFELDARSLARLTYLGLL